MVYMKRRRPLLLRCVLIPCVALIPLIFVHHPVHSQQLDSSFEQFLRGLTFVKSTDGRAFVALQIQPPSAGDLQTRLANGEPGRALDGLMQTVQLGGLWPGVEGVVAPGGVAISPDGQQVVFSLDSGAYADLYVTNIDGTEPHQLTHNGELGANRAENPWWTPLDGRIFFDQQIAGVLTAHAVHSDGSELEPLLPGGYRLRLSPNSSNILYNLPAGHANSGAYAGDLLATETIKLSTNPALAEWSPSGTHIAFNHASHLFIRTMADATERRLVTANIQGAPLWSPAGKQIAFGSLSSSLHVARADGLGSLNLTGNAHDSPITPLLWSPDDRYVLYRALAEGIYVIDVVSGERHLLLALAEGDVAAAAFVLAQAANVVPMGQVAAGNGGQPAGATSGDRAAEEGRTAGRIGANSLSALGIPPWLIGVAAALLLAGLGLVSLRNLMPGLAARGADMSVGQTAPSLGAGAPMSPPKPMPQSSAPAKQPHPFHQLDPSGTLAQHGPEIADHAFIHQLQSGVAPDGQIRPVRAATRFTSYDNWLSTRQAALHELQRQAQQEGIDLNQPPQPGQPDRRKLTLAHGRYIGDGFVGQGQPLTRLADGQPVKVYGHYAQLAGIAHTTTTLHWNPESRQWEIDQHYPDANKKLGIMATA